MKLLEKYWYYIVAIFTFFMFVKPVICFLILGSSIFYAGTDYYRVFRILENYGIQTTGKILKYYRGRGGYQTPIFTFITKNEKSIEAEPYFYVSSDINKFRTFKNYIQKPIEIKYNPDNPEEFMIENQKTINIIGIIALIIVGSFFSIIGILDILEIIHINFQK